MPLMPFQYFLFCVLDNLLSLSLSKRTYFIHVSQKLYGNLSSESTIIYVFSPQINGHSLGFEAFITRRLAIANIFIYDCRVEISGVKYRFPTIKSRNQMLSYF